MIDDNVQVFNSQFRNSILVWSKWLLGKINYLHNIHSKYLSTNLQLYKFSVLQFKSSDALKNYHNLQVFSPVHLQSTIKARGGSDFL